MNQRLFVKQLEFYVQVYIILVYSQFYKICEKIDPASVMNAIFPVLVLKFVLIFKVKIILRDLWQWCKVPLEKERVSKSG